MNPYERIVSEIADACSGRLVKRVVRRLQRIPITLSGEDSGLQNAWDDTCAQVQQEQSVFWEMFDEMVESAIEAELGKMVRYELEALWIETDEGVEWSGTDEAEGARAAPSTPTVVSAIKMKVYGRASDWTNARLREYLKASDESG